MGKITGFKEFERVLPPKEAVEARVQHFKEFNKGYSENELNKQAARCMDCGIPFCHSGCPLGNVIPEFNDAVYDGKWEEAYQILTSTNNFPEFTGRICPAPCESACVLGIHSNPITIEEIEKHIIEIAFKKGYVKPHKSYLKTGKSVAIVGSGPAGLAAAAQLNKAGHDVVVFERDDQVGGLLRYGIPDFKLEKSVIDRRVNLMKESGIEFRVNSEVGRDISFYELKAYDAVILATGSTVPWHMQLPGHDAKGIHFAMEFLTQQNKEVSGIAVSGERILATDKHVVVIGDGDTGSDCIGTSNRHRAKSITQIARKPMPSKERLKNNPWPLDKVTFATSSSQEEGCERLWATETQEFVKDENGHIKGIKIKEVQYEVDDFGRRTRLGESEVREIPADLVLLAIGYQHTEHTLLEQLGVRVDEKGNILANDRDYRTTIDNIFTAGDCRKGQSLVVWAISEGRECARKVDEYLMGYSELESKDFLTAQHA
ncbi:glutamate synthase subunit beta [Sphingobacterium thalpophilum]|uniref:Glutamate synthase [NADPH] small chain n=1 Tax=Sphingobacterium thalpophilum TaxID=259 RepID=A0A4U9UI23_9SPHI|nr:glutamate synthase subunit beta [Sphingobacterium thalpophilum]VTR31262.1 Glutamate synthase [NADPH] small chain [Sphingobacterium thalpophilum]